MKKVILIALAVNLMAGEGPLGVVNSRGNLQVDRMPVSGQGSVNSGSVVQTADHASRVDLSQVAVTLGPRSQARFYQDRLLLAEGQGVVAARRNFTVEALGFRVSPSDGSAVARVEYADPRRIVVAALNGGLTVKGEGGITVARVRSGTALTLEPGEGRTSIVTGHVRHEGGKFLLSDRTTGLTVELSGRGLEAHTGKHVRVTGEARANRDGTSQVIEVTSITVARVRETDEEPVPGGGAPTKKTKSVSTASKAGKLGGMSTGAKTALALTVIGGGVGLGVGIYEATASN
ncbi:MAG: hypothetical protein FJW40_02885 [Acidobacteria bacterium]|nr:hypothetical protein [Acidobacteriota bacterium]